MEGCRGDGGRQRPSWERWHLNRDFEEWIEVDQIIKAWKSIPSRASRLHNFSEKINITECIRPHTVSIGCEKVKQIKFMRYFIESLSRTSVGMMKSGAHAVLLEILSLFHLSLLLGFSLIIMALFSSKQQHHVIWWKIWFALLSLSSTGSQARRYKILFEFGPQALNQAGWPARATCYLGVGQAGHWDGQSPRSPVRWVFSFSKRNMCGFYQKKGEGILARLKQVENIKVLVSLEHKKKWIKSWCIFYIKLRDFSFIL